MRRRWPTFPKMAKPKPWSPSGSLATLGPDGAAGLALRHVSVRPVTDGKRTFEGPLAASGFDPGCVKTLKFIGRWICLCGELRPRGRREDVWGAGSGGFGAGGRQHG